VGARHVSRTRPHTARALRRVPSPTTTQAPITVEVSQDYEPGLAPYTPKETKRLYQQMSRTTPDTPCSLATETSENDSQPIAEPSPPKDSHVPEPPEHEPSVAATDAVQDTPRRRSPHWSRPHSPGSMKEPLQQDAPYASTAHHGPPISFARFSCTRVDGMRVQGTSVSRSSAGGEAGSRKPAKKASMELEDPKPSWSPKKCRSGGVHRSRESAPLLLINYNKSQGVPPGYLESERVRKHPAASPLVSEYSLCDGTKNNRRSHHGAADSPRAQSRQSQPVPMNAMSNTQRASVRGDRKINSRYSAGGGGLGFVRIQKTHAHPSNQSDCSVEFRPIESSMPQSMHMQPRKNDQRAMSASGHRRLNPLYRSSQFPQFQSKVSHINLKFTPNRYSKDLTNTSRTLNSFRNDVTTAIWGRKSQGTSNGLAINEEAWRNPTVLLETRGSFVGGGGVLVEARNNPADRARAQHGPAHMTNPKAAIPTGSPVQSPRVTAGVPALVPHSQSMRLYSAPISRISRDTHQHDMPMKDNHRASHVYVQDQGFRTRAASALSSSERGAWRQNSKRAQGDNNGVDLSTSLMVSEHVSAWGAEDTGPYLAGSTLAAEGEEDLMHFMDSLAQSR